MATTKEFIAYILDKTNGITGFSIKPMFGEYMHYYNGVVTGLICNNTFFIKVTPNTTQLLNNLNKASPYPKAKEQYILNDDYLENKELLLTIFKQFTLGK